ncbi:two-component sensor histidine kinase [Neolewinella xylanilytica]|uniref:histidine kinase n=1 Tax=Neolewinella xylanilytica TaxID=1514080 RepID=A0A2S6I4V8_9BACT|nr:sensor histidine kinase [Neolewinella xylanilytica]PPK86195.1 two-component sensor histidine kinase [Neolewinella xylanilytica]
MYLVRLLLLFTSFIVGASVAFAGTEPIAALTLDKDLQSKLDRAEYFIQSGQTDRASNLLTDLYQRLASANALDTPFGLWVRLRRARAWERSRRYSPATSELLRIIGESHRADQPEIRARAYLLMALIHEQQGHAKRTLRYLELAREVTEARQLAVVEARLSIRYASYHRLFGEKDSALAFSQRALEQAIALDQTYERAIANLLLSMLFRTTNPMVSEQHLRQASTLYQGFNNPVFSLIIALHFSDLRVKAGAYDQALVSNDSALHFANSVGDRYSEVASYLGSVYDDRSGILRRLGQYDSAFHYLALGRASELENIQQAHAESIAEIEARYHDEEKLQLIEKQQAQLADRQRWESWLNRFLSIGGVALLILIFYYVRLRKANRLLAEQSLLIGHSNEQLNASLKEQQLLRGELHHRIKNNLQVIIGLLDMQAENLADPARRVAVDGLIERVHSMAAIHDILYQESNLHRISLLRYVRRICDHFHRIAGHDEDCQLELDFPDCYFNPDTLIPLGTMLNELKMNSYKHARRPGIQLRVRVSLELVGEEYVLTYRDNGPGYARDYLNSQESLGLYLLKGLSRQLSGRIQTYNDDGAVTVIYFRQKNAEPGVSPAVQSRTKAVPLRT